MNSIHFVRCPGERALSYGLFVLLGLATALGASGALAAVSTTTALGLSSNPIQWGGFVTLTGTVSGGNKPSGTVTFKQGTTTIGTGTVSSGVAHYTFTPTATGSFSLTAVYGGDSKNQGSTSGATSLAVNPAVSTTTLAAAPSLAYAGHSVTLTASVNGSSPSGTVTFNDGADALGTATISAGQASLATTTLAQGGHSLTAAYAGDAANTASISSSVALQVNAPVQLPAPPTSPTPVANYEYDAEGNPTKTVQAPGVAGFGFATSSSYDALSRLSTRTDAKNGVTQLGYDGQDRVTSIIDPRNLTTQSPRNGLGDATSLSSPDTGTATHTYDAAGNLLTRTDSRGVLATSTYDALNRQTVLVFSKSGQANLSYGWTYDQTGAGFSYGVGRLTTSSFPAGSRRYTYDALGRLASTTQTVGAANLVSGNGYESAGHLVQLTYPSGRVLTISHASGLPTGMQLAKNASGTPVALLSQIGLLPFGGVQDWQWQMASGPTPHRREFDTNGRMVRYPLGAVVRDLTYDAADRIVSFTHLDAMSAAAVPTLDQGFVYDELGRLTGITTASVSWSLGYDANGNRTDVTLNGSTRNYAVSATSNQLNALDNPARSFGLDAAGNTTSDTASYTSTYGLDNRLTTLTKGATTASYSYDNNGQRVSKTVNGVTTLFVYDQDGQLLGEYDQAGNAIQEYAWFAGMPVAVFKTDPANQAGEPLVYYIHTDHLDTPRVIVDRGGNVRWRWLAEPFGTTAAETNPSGLGAFAFNLRFPGQYADPESGLFYNWHRDYDPGIGRYVQSDPIGLDGGINTYAYVGANPLSYADPFGLFEVKGYPSNTFDKRKYPQSVQELYRYAENLKRLIDKACPGNNKAKELYEKWVVEIVGRGGNPTTRYGANTSEFTRDYFDMSTHKPGAPDKQFTFMHEFMHLTDKNNKLKPSTGTYMEAYINGVSNDLPIEKNADQLVRDLMNGVCPCE